jgi:2-dehydro-3-deoxyphosphogalactonate aldolase
MNPELKWRQALAALPLVAILRGLKPEEAMPVGQVLWDSGWRLLEVPLNSPQPLLSIERLAQAFPEALVGAGTVMSAHQVREVKEAGGQLIISPHFDPAVVGCALELGMVCLPGVLTPSEAFAALHLGAQGIKLFPAEMLPPAALQALRAVLPEQAVVLPVGGIRVEHMASYRSAGASGFGIGSSLYKPGRSAPEVRQQAQRFTHAWAATMQT